MDASPSASPHLRLVEAPLPTPARAEPQDARAKATARENRSAALSISDARWVLAAQVAQSLEGDRAAILRPEQRQRLTRIATRLGLRPFDAALIMAVVQDAARSGEPAAVRGLSRSVESRLTLIAPPRRRTESPKWMVATVLASFALASVLLLALLNWLMR